MNAIYTVHRTDPIMHVMVEAGIHEASLSVMVARSPW